MSFLLLVFSDSYTPLKWLKVLHVLVIGAYIVNFKSLLLKLTL